MYSESAVDDSSAPNGAAWDLGTDDSTNEVVEDSQLEVNDFVDTAFDAEEENQNNVMVDSIDENVDTGPVG